ncbi:MAG: tetratricopeptide repeat protein, partial [Planctomycetes bacterium]|nr:tetratricopeptide repeat protein [Planctomycetota bacterium]
MIRIAAAAALLATGMGDAAARAAGGPRAEKPAKKATGRQQPGGGQAAPAAALPPRARLGFDALQPPVKAPSNPPGANELPERVKDDVEAAEKHLADRKYSEALNLLERAVGFAPRSAIIHRMLGRAYLGLGNRGKAREHLAAAVKAAPDDLDSQLLLGELLAAQQNGPDAILHLRTALKCSQAAPDDPRTGEALLTLSLLLDRQGYWTAALAGYTKLTGWIEKYPRRYASRPSLRDWALHPERLYSRRGGLLLLLHRSAEAAELLERAYRRDRSSAPTARLLVAALLAERQYKRVESVLLEMLGEPSQKADVAQMIGDLCKASADESLPGRFWKACRKRHRARPLVGIALARAARHMGWRTEARDILDSIVTVQPGRAELWEMLGRDYADANQPDEFFQTARKGLLADPNALAAVAAGVEKFASASTAPGVERRLAELARKDRSKVAYALLYLAGRAATARAKHILAADLYNRAIARKPDFFRAYEDLLGAYLAQKRFDLVDRLLKRVNSAAGGTHLPAYLRGKIALSQGNATDAAAALEEALKQKPHDATISLLLAKAYVQAGKVSSAARVLAEAFAANGQNATIAKRLFDIYMGGGQLREARDLAASILQRERRSVIGRLMLAELALRAGKRDSAKMLISQLAREAPDNVDVQLLALRIALGGPTNMLTKKQFDTAAERLNRLIRLRPDSRAEAYQPVESFGGGVELLLG